MPPAADDAPWILRPIRESDDRAVRDIIHAVMTEHGCSGAAYAPPHAPTRSLMSPAADDAPWILRPIRESDDRAVRDIIHAVMTEHGCSGAGFAIHDAEVDAMTAAYRQARAGYYVVERGGVVLGGAGFAQLDGSHPDDAVCELRKMYFLPEARGRGLGHAMLALLLEEMRRAGFQRCYLETTSWMDAAQRLYRAAGFTVQDAAEGATGHHGCDCFFSKAL